jgi:hypothetical protein
MEIGVLLPVGTGVISSILHPGPVEDDGSAVRFGVDHRTSLGAENSLGAAPC